MAALVRSPICRLSTPDVEPIFEEDAEVVCGLGVAARVGPRERLFSVGQPVFPREHHRELERAVGVAAIVGPAVRRLGTSKITTLFEQYA
ncbi:MAG TPA: hypothetical protein VLW51_04030 [Solirubrobacteraceae bacterium]|nr:hypothetical protein [Solirubrobacteraceae bacterium]